MKRLRLSFCTVILGLLGAVLYSAAQSGGRSGSTDLLRQNGPSLNPYFGVEGDSQLLDQLAGPFANRPKPRKIIDEISDPAERRAFAALHHKRSAQARLMAAQQFLEDFPQSWFVWQAYEIAAKACINQGDNKSAIKFARQSLRILPENPLLQVPLADVETMDGETGRGHTGCEAGDPDIGPLLVTGSLF
ncbi:MAG: hypothetical protein ABSE93_23290 [Terriglobia bacterium]|jgi:hypothetical protein